MGNVHRHMEDCFVEVLITAPLIENINASPLRLFKVARISRLYR